MAENDHTLASRPVALQACFQPRIGFQQGYQQRQREAEQACRPACDRTLAGSLAQETGNTYDTTGVNTPHTEQITVEGFLSEQTQGSVNHQKAMGFRVDARSRVCPGAAPEFRQHRTVAGGLMQLIS